MSYTVLARKYRPQTFADLVGQEHISRTLANAITGGRVAHAFLFTGARGVGKTTTARLLAKALNCEQGPTPTPCNSCDPCREITLGTDLDVLEIDGASNNSVDDVRRLQESLPYRPARDRFKVVIVDEVHMLSAGAFNAFLKTLEEPPPHVKFIFATTEIHKVPITIRSRCQRYDFRLIPHAVVGARVRAILAHEKISADDEAIAIVVREAAGSLRDALTVLDQLLAFGGEALKGEQVARELGIADQKRVVAALAAMLAGDAAGCLRAAVALSEQGLDVMHFARQLLALMRDLVVLRVVGDDGELVDRPDEERKHALEIAQLHNPQHLERAFAGLSALVDEAGEAGNPQLALEMGLVRLADRPALEPLSELIGRLATIEQRLGGGSTSAGGAAARPAKRELRDRGRGEAASPGQNPGPSPNPIQNPGPSPNPIQNPNPSQSPVQSQSPDRGPDRNRVRDPDRTPDRDRDRDRVRTPVRDPDPDRNPIPASDTASDSEVPEAWQRIVLALHEAQPALGAVLEHGVPVQISAARLVLSFPEGSFFGRQAMSEAARQALGEAAARVFGQRPAIEIGIGLQSKRPTVAAQEAARRKERRAEKKADALAHPLVKDAMEVFPEAEGHVDVHVED